MKNDRFTALIPTVFLTACCLGANAKDAATIQPFFEKHCVTCHGEEKQKGKFRLDDVSTFDAEDWQLVYEQLASQEMPPDDEPQPTEAEREATQTRVLAMAVEGSASIATSFRRLNKREYGNTVRDLLGLRSGTFDPSEYIYDDEIDHGFDTEAESLVISNELLIEYMGAARKSLQHALFSSDQTKPAPRSIEVDLHKVAGTSRRYINHAKDHVIGRSGGKAKLYDGARDRAMAAPGRYTITVTASGVDREFYPIRFAPAKGPLVMGFGIMPQGTASLSGHGVLQRTFELQDDVEQTFQFDTWIDKDHFPYFTFENGSGKPITQIRSNIRQRKIPPSASKQPFRGPGIKLTQFRIEGPFYDQWPPESFQKTYDATTIPDLTKATAREAVLHRFAERAFRRPVAQGEIADYLTFLEREHAAKGDWHEALIETLSAMMASADFLYIRDTDLADDSSLSAYGLANRLSYFLWSTMPDETLFDLAASGAILKPAVLQQQVSRLLADPRAAEFTQSFADQWLALDKLGTMPPDAKAPQFKDYYRNQLEPAMREETRRFFAHVLEENRSVNEFIDSDYSFLNRGLASLYNVPFEGGPGEFMRVTFPAGTPRGGLLGHASILALTSNGVETSPVERGHWVLDELLGTPPPPAPKEVPALVPDLNGATTVRDQLAKHRSDPTCIECHRQMDPLGFALEAYDPIGRLRTRYENDRPVTTHGNYKGEDFPDIVSLKKIMLADTRPFARNLTIRIAEYAKGRAVEAGDFAAVEMIVDDTAADGFPLRDIIERIATGELLRIR